MIEAVFGHPPLAGQRCGAARPPGVRELVDRANTGANAWADSAYRSQDREVPLRDDGWRSRIPHKRQKGKP